MNIFLHFVFHHFDARVQTKSELCDVVSEVSKLWLKSIPIFQEIKSLWLRISMPVTGLQRLAAGRFQVAEFYLVFENEVELILHQNPVLSTNQRPKRPDFPPLQTSTSTLFRINAI